MGHHSEFSALKTQKFLLHKSMAVGLTWRFPQEFKKKFKGKKNFCHDKKIFSALLISILFSKFSDIAFLLWKISTLTTPDWDMLCPHVVQTSTCHWLVHICTYFDVLRPQSLASKIKKLKNSPKLKWGSNPRPWVP